MRRLWSSIVVSTLVAAGCFAPKYNSGDLHCATGQVCPSGFHCAPDNRCYKLGVNPDLGTRATKDMAFVDGMLGDLAASPDLQATVTLSPPAPAWTAAGGGEAMASSGNQIGVSVGGSIVGGTAIAPSGAIVTFGYFSSDTY